MPLTERELHVIRDIEARLEASSPELARRLTPPQRVPGPATSGLASSHRRVAAVLAALVAALVVATIATSLGVRVGLAVALILVEAVSISAVAHFGRRGRRSRPDNRAGK